MLAAVQNMGFSTTDKVFSPERLPHTGALFPSIQRSPDVAGYTNSKLSARKKEVSEMLSKSMAGIPESLPSE